MGRSDLSAPPTTASGSGRALRLAVYSTTTERGGAEIVTGHLLEQLRADIDVTVIGTDAAIVAWMASRRPRTQSVVVAPIESRYQLRRMLAFRSVVARLQPDVIHFVLPWAYDARWEMLVATTIRTVAVVAVEHSQFPLPTRRSGLLKRLLERRLDAHVAVSTSIARELEASARDRNGVRVIYNGVPDISLEFPVTGEPPAPSAGKVLGTIARLDHMKGVDVLLRALAPLADARLIVVGHGPDESALRALASELGVDDRVEWAGWSDRPAEQLARFDVFVLPSRAEGLALSICEAMLAGLPVVATDVGGNPEVVANGETGILVPVDDPAALSGALATLLDDQRLRSQMGAAGRRRARDQFTAPAMARTYEALYDELVTTLRTTSTTKPRTTSVE